MSVPSELLARASDRCELCGSSDALEAIDVPGRQPVDAAVVCAVCAAQISEDEALDANHWYCLQQSVWSEVPAVQVLSWRMLNRFVGQQWAVDLLDQVYLDEDTLAWASRGLPGAGSEADADSSVTRDSNGAPLADGDTVTLIKSLDVKGTTFIAKRGTVVKGIRLTSNPEHVEGKVNGVQLVLKAAFLKRVA